MSPEPEVRWGILGTGTIAQRFANAVQRTPRARLAAVASRTIARAEEFAMELGGGIAAFGSYEDLAATELDIVYIATPQHRHVADAHVVLDAGRHVLIEKPLAMSSREVEAVAAHARTADRLAVEAMWTYFNPLVEHLLEHVRVGRLGGLRSMFAVCGPLGIPRGHRALDPSLGGSFLRECLVYPLSILTALDEEFLDPDTISAVLHQRAQVDDSGAVILARGARFAQFGGAIREGAPGAAGSRLQFAFDRAWVEFDDAYNPSTLRIGWVDGDLEVHREPASAVGLGYEVAALSAAVLGERTLASHAGIERTTRNTRLIERIAAATSRLESPSEFLG